MCQVMITVTSTEGKPQHLWVKLSDPADTFSITVHSARRVSTHVFHTNGHLAKAARIVPFERRPVQHHQHQHAVGA